ncbi:MAG: thioredoxin fold domain-containing protein [Piscinibacter sp.]|nr:thioredoxin fold domain-containing protein [Piscinibacter sp.]
MQRRHLLLSLAAASAAALAACSKNDAAAPAAAAPAAPRPTSPAEAYALAATGHGFTVGALMAANTVYVFFDTTCPHCAELWKASQPLLNRLKFVWMPVGLLRPQSGPQGATILGAPDPVAAMNENEASVLARGGGITANPTDEVLAKVKANTDIFNRLGADSVPLILYRNAATGLHGQRAGAVDTAGLAALVGI